MYILIAVVLASSVGLAAHYLIPDRDRRGVVIAPMIGAVVSALLYTILQWAGVAETNFWLWLASVGGGIAAAIGGTIALTRLRQQRDTAEAIAQGIIPS